VAGRATRREGKLSRKLLSMMEFTMLECGHEKSTRDRLALLWVGTRKWSFKAVCGSSKGCSCGLGIALDGTR
jgi:hypothetical protein